MRVFCPVFLLCAAALVLCRPAPVSADKAPRESKDVSIKVGKDAIHFFVGKALVTCYHIGPKVAKPYFYPLNAPSGAPLTRPWPMGPLEEGEKKGDHPHQRSAWFTHGDVIPEGMKLAKRTKSKEVVGVDFWSEAAGHGRIVCVKVGEVKHGKGRASVQTHNEWRTADDKKILDEVRTIELFSFGDAWLLRVTSHLHAPVVAITFGDTKEGSFGVRVRDVMRADKKGKLVNAEGKVGEGKRNNAKRDGCWGLVSNWCDYSGPTGGGTAGVAIFADPKNAIPTAWHARNYGLLAANPFGREKSRFPDTRSKKELVKLPKGKSLTLTYALLLHKGDAREGKVAEHYDRFTKLPGARE
jgi:hypothetical protein